MCIRDSANWIGQIFSARGELLWQGRKTRLATPAQINGLISRDGGCVECGAHHSKCVAHHLLPWEAPRKGPTNINNLVFVCDDCHVRLHRNKQTMFYDPKSQTWKTRRATPDEIPPDGGPAPTPRPANTRRNPRNRNLNPAPNHVPSRTCTNDLQRRASGRACSETGPSLQAGRGTVAGNTEGESG